MVRTIQEEICATVMRVLKTTFLGALVKVNSYRRSSAIRGDDNSHKTVLRFATFKQQSAERFRVSLQFLF